MKFILRRAKGTSHFMLYQTKRGVLVYLVHFPALLFVWAVGAIVGLGSVSEWWSPWLPIAGIPFVLYLVHTFRQPWEGEKLPLVQATKL